MPSQANRHQGKPYVAPLYENLRDQPAVAVALVSDDGHLSTKHCMGQGLLGATTERLTRLRRIDSGQPYAMLSPTVVEQCQRVPICDADYGVLERAGCNCGAPKHYQGQHSALPLHY